MADRTGQQLDNYQLQRLLGQGTFGEVYLAKHLHRHTIVAIKVLTMQFSQAMLESFLQEARTLFLLKHPHIVPLLDFGLESKYKAPFLVMEYAPNGTLGQRHRKGGRVPLEQVNAYVQQVAQALQYAHDQRLIHRDVKPQNMLLSQDGRVLLGDFGVAAIAHSENSLATQGITGTIPYMAPEQLQGKPRPASDQYALGICAYEWLSGARPFVGSTIEVVNQHLSSTPASLRASLPELPVAVEEVILRTLAKDPQQRFASMAAFAQALQQAIQLPAARPDASSLRSDSSGLATAAPTTASEVQSMSVPQTPSSVPPTYSSMSVPQTPRPASPTYGQVPASSYIAPPPPASGQRASSVSPYGTAPSQTPAYGTASSQMPTNPYAQSQAPALPYPASVEQAPASLYLAPPPPPPQSVGQRGPSQPLYGATPSYPAREASIEPSTQSQPPSWDTSVPPGFAPPLTPPVKKGGLKVWLCILIAVVVLGAGGGGTAYYFATRPQPVITLSSSYHDGSTSVGASTTTFSLLGHDFTNNSAITFLLDGNLIAGAPRVQSDSHGQVGATLSVSGAWSVGTHTLTARDANGYTTKTGAKIEIVTPGRANTPGPNGAPTDSTTMTITATVIVGKNSGVTPLFVKNGSVCSTDDDGKPHTLTGSSSGVSYTETVVQVCSGSYADGKVSYTETVTSLHATFSNGIPCQASKPFINQHLEGTFTSATAVSGSYSTDPVTLICALGVDNSTTPAEHGTWTGSVALK
jgi:serine/threonine protein kinase